MTALFIYLVKVNIALVIFCAGYYAVLRHLTFYTLNRVYLVCAILFATLYPLVNFQDLLNRHQEIARPVQLVIVNWQAPVTHAVQQAQQHSKWYWLELVFWTGVIVLAIRFITQLLSLYRLHKQSKPMQLHQYFVRVIQGDINPFSFWKSIYINPENHDPAELKAILAHEQIHVNEWHTLDILLGELSTIFYWFNPGIWLMKRAIRENIEFITDRKILQDGSDPKAYQYSLLNVTFSGGHNAIVNHFNTSTIKKRIMMMNSKRSSPINLTRYAILVPAVVALVLVFTVSKAELGKQIAKGNAAIEKAFSLTVNNITSENVNRLTAATKRKLMILPDAVSSVFTESSLRTAIDTPKVGKIIGESSNAITVIGYGKAKNDTIEVRRDAVVQSLLNKVQGWAVNADGSVTISSQPITKIMLNGKPYTFNSTTTDSIPKIRVIDQYATSTFQQNPTPAGVVIRNMPTIAGTNNIRVRGGDPNVQPLIVVNGKIENDMLQIDQDNIQSMTVLKGTTASNLYGDRAKNGAILIDTKTEPEHIVTGYRLPKPEPMIVVDGKTVSKEYLNQVSADKIKSVNVLKDRAAATTYGADAKNGVIEVTTSGNPFGGGTITSTTPRVINFNAKTIFSGKLLLLNGKETTEAELNKIPAENLKVIKPLTEKEKTKYGDKAKNGGFSITTIK